MLQDTALWIAVAVVLVGFGIAYALPSSRPYAKKYWWLFVATAVGLAAFALLRRRAGHSVDEAIEEGQDIAEQNSSLLDGVVDMALEKHEIANIELTSSRQKSEIDRQNTTIKLEAISKVDDSMARRKALVALSKEIS
jgi:hypothetical protein